MSKLTPADALRAAQEEGEKVVVIWCGRSECGSRAKPLGAVRRSTLGFLFDATLPGDVSVDPADKARILDGFRRIGVRRVPMVMAGRCIVLLEHETTGSDTPAVECPTCGRIPVNERELLRRARSHRLGLRPARMTVRRDEHNVG